jgi:glutamate-ammonia-ligase adenylyltransferase
MRMEREVARERPGVHHAKAGRGGVADIEFIVQRLQLLHGHAQPALQCGNTVTALTRLVGQGLLDAESAEVLRGAYLFLRRLENRVRLVRDREAVALDTRTGDAIRLARQMGYGDLPGRSATDQLIAHYRRHTEAVRQLYERHFGEETDDQR